MKKNNLLLFLIITFPIISSSQITPDVLFHVEGIGSKRSSPNSNHSEVLALFENTKQVSHTAINISSDLIRDPIIYFSGDEFPVWDIRNDYSDGNAFNFRWQGYFGINKTILKLRSDGSLTLPQFSGGGKVYADSNGKLSVGKEEIMTFGPQDFLPWIDDGSSVEYTTFGVKASSEIFYDGSVRAIVHLPHQCIINKIKIIYLDKDSGDNFNFTFSEVNEMLGSGSNGASGELVTFSPSGSSSAWQVEIIDNLNAQIDNDKYFYYLNFSDDDWSEQEIRLVKIYYTE